MHIFLNRIGKQFNREWIFRDVDIEIHAGSSVAILGANGSGKSTLLQIISGSLSPSKGEITYHHNSSKVSLENLYKYIVFVAPYLELPEELTLEEIIQFHFAFKEIQSGLSEKELITILNLDHAKTKQIRYFSSGMKQRLKLALAFFSDVPLLLLDEPTSNLDSSGISWYKMLINNYSKNKTIIVCSNQEQEYDFCTEIFFIEEYKK